MFCGNGHSAKLVKIFQLCNISYNLTLGFCTSRTALSDMPIAELVTKILFRRLDDFSNGKEKLWSNNSGDYS